MDPNSNNPRNILYFTKCCNNTEYIVVSWLKTTGKNGRKSSCVMSNIYFYLLYSIRIPDFGKHTENKLKSSVTWTPSVTKTAFQCDGTKKTSDFPFKFSMTKKTEGRCRDGWVLISLWSGKLQYCYGVDLFKPNWCWTLCYWSNC